ncbi:protein SMG7-like [Nylanderia fulva]|uniref:protein SMG7-like n=1 Tax=Nylanderia fulva TaxID=613905 RepID=UPI0010FB2153|nr:protein SMG7-like [Nylanderia fulva]XP_029175565.1 protein SMG7-like [Nylanderia fulva]XP_029175566.1 protein SMG7-like [Nylanderia fulva]XP_029175567.1 protein SMG7-like [Nylanderia fulva]
MGLKAAVQALKKAEPLKDKVQRCKDLLNDNDAWVCQQQLQKIYQQVLILDLEYALDRKVEQELWNLGFKNYIATLQSQAKDRKNPKRGESQALLSWCLEAASGFYLTLLQEICTVFDLDLPFRRKGYVYGYTSPWKAVEKLSPPHKSSCFYACQYCLVHLGDIARYRNESKQAEMFYRHAVSLSPSSGQPYNQLALLEASRGDKLGTVFHYARSVAVKHPFPVATANLATTLSSALNDKSFNIDGKTKLNSQEYIAVFLKLHGIIHNFGDLKLACSYSKQLTETLTALVATESFSPWMLIQMLVINLYALQHAAGSGPDNTELLKNEQLTNDEKMARDCILDLIAGTLSALLLPVYTIKNSIIEYFALPSIKLCLDWINIKPTVLEEVAFTSRLQIWPSLCVLLNALQNCVVDFKHDEYAVVPLPEDRDLQGFLPLEKSFENLRFTNTALEGDTAMLNKLRAVRILHLGRCLAQNRINGSAPISITTEEKTGESRFTSMSNGVGPSNELMKELEELSLNKELKQLNTSMSPVLSEAASSKSSTETDAEIPVDKKIFQGILKPQGSLERNRDSETSGAEACSLPSSSARKPRQNIAMQAIMRRAETEQKQVTFKNVSPVIVEEENDKKTKATVVAPINTSMANKPTPILEMPKTNEASSTNNSVVSAPTRLSMMSTGSQSQSPLVQSQQRSVKPTLPPNIPIPTQLVVVKEQQAQQVAQQMLPQLHAGNITTQITNQQTSTGLGPVCYPNQSFNAQNPQFANNFMTNRSPHYQMQGQLSNNGQPVTAIPQSINGIHHSISQSRPLHQRMPQSVPSVQMIQQSMRLGSPAQPSMLQPNINLPANNMGLQASINVEQQNHAIGLQQQQQQNIMQSNSRSNSMHSQLNGSPGMANVPAMMSTLPSVYEKDPQQSSLTTLVNSSQSPTSGSNFQLNFNQNHFNQSQTFVGQGPLSQNQPSPSFYKNNAETMDFQFPNQKIVNKNQPPPQQQPVTNNYNMFCNYEPTEHFNLWRDSRPPQPPIAWWGPAGNTTAQMHMKDSIVNENAFSNWSDSSTLGNMANRVPLTPGKNYQQQQQNGQHGRHLMAGNNFEDSRLFEVEQKPSQPVSTGNTYSLFSSNTWSTVNTPINTNSTSQDQMKARLHQQSLWSGPGPSPLERLLEQQKSLREGGTT